MTNPSNSVQESPVELSLFLPSLMSFSFTPPQEEQDQRGAPLHDYQTSIAGRLLLCDSFSDAMWLLDASDNT
jgi:hypothetical protein